MNHEYELAAGPLDRAQELREEAKRIEKAERAQRKREKRQRRQWRQRQRDVELAMKTFREIAADPDAPHADRIKAAEAMLR